jgi:hypothetical protein
LNEQELFWFFFCIPDLYVCMSIAITIVLHLGKPKFSRFIFLRI